MFPEGFPLLFVFLEVRPPTSSSHASSSLSGLPCPLSSMRTQGPIKASLCYNALYSSGECGGHRKPSLYIQFSSHTGIQAVPPKACEHITGICRNPGHRFQFGGKANKASAGSLPPAEPPLCEPLHNHVRRRASWGREHSRGKGCQCRDTGS